MPHCTFFSPEKLALLPLLEDVKPPPNRKMIKLFKHLITCFHHYDILAKTCKTSSRMTTASRFAAKMMLIYARALLSIEKICYPKLFSS